jgi:iron-sulfur cluster repair protein YtfE (RIC family)
VDLRDWTVNELLVTAPAAVGILNHFGIDTCCGGSRTLAESARSVGLTPEALIAALAPAVETAQERPT